MKILLKTQIKREQGKLYFCSTSNDGYLNVCETIAARGRKKNGKK